jgi:long-chain acyl-CoA synthetase
LNIAHNLDQSAMFFPDNPVFVFEDQTTTYKQLYLKVNQLAKGLENMGMGKGDRIAVFLPNIPEFIIIYFAAQKIGAIVVALNVLLKKDEVKHILTDSGARIIFAGKEQAVHIPAHEVDTLEKLILVGEESVDNDHINKTFDSATTDFIPLEMASDDPAAILYTSGTTGTPKGATLTQSNIVSNVNATICHIGMKTDDVIHLFLPLFHCFGQNFIMNACVKMGACMVMHQKFEPDPVVSAISKYKVTMFFAVPTIYTYFLNMKDEDLDLSSIRYYFTAAAIMPTQVAEKWQNKYKIPINDGYGLTESSPFASYNHDLKYKLGSIGKPIMNVEMKIVDEDKNEVTRGEWGEICIKGPNVMQGYWNQPEETAKAIKDDWLFTGDVGTIDEQGYYFVVDRIKDLIISAGNNIYPAEVENVLYKHPAVLEAAVFGKPDDIKGEAVAAAVVLQPGKSVEPDELIGFCRSKMAKYKAPKHIIFIDELPKSPTGKILKRVLRQND